MGSLRAKNDPCVCNMPVENNFDTLIDTAEGNEEEWKKEEDDDANNSSNDSSILKKLTEIVKCLKKERFSSYGIS